MFKKRLGGKFSLESTVKRLRGKACWAQVAKRDWPLYSDIYADQVVLVGGHTGNLAKRLLDRHSEILKMHAYEPDPKFCSQSRGLLSEYVEKGVVTVFNEAIYDSDAKLQMVSAGDWSTLKATGRNILNEGFDLSEIEVVTTSVETMMSRLDPFRDFSLVMNCEGSEYLIIGEILKFGTLPQTIISQMHTVGENPVQKLYETRSKLAESFTPIICCDWAWDIWIRNDLMTISAETSERMQD